MVYNLRRSRNRQKQERLRKTCKNIFNGVDYFDLWFRGGPWIQEFLIGKGGGGGGGGVGSERPVELFCGKLLLTETTTCFSTCERRSPLAPQVLLCEQKRTDHRIYQFVDEELQLQTSVRSDGVGKGGRGGGWIRHWWWKIFNVRSCPRIVHADIRDIFIFIVNSRWEKIEEERNALDAMKQSLEKEGGKINRVLLV